MKFYMSNYRSFICSEYVQPLLSAVDNTIHLLCISFSLVQLSCLNLFGFWTTSGSSWVLLLALHTGIFSRNQTQISCVQDKWFAFLYYCCTQFFWDECDSCKMLWIINYLGISYLLEEDLQIFCSIQQNTFCCSA